MLSVLLIKSIARLRSGSRGHAPMGADAGAPVGEGVSDFCRPRQQITPKTPSARIATSALSHAGFPVRGGGAGAATRAASSTARGALAGIGGVVPPASSCVTRSTNVAGVSPPGSRVHCTVMNESGTSASQSFVSSTHTGTRNGVPFAIRCVRSSASFHSRRK